MKCLDITPLETCVIIIPCVEMIYIWSKQDALTFETRSPITLKEAKGYCSRERLEQHISGYFWQLQRPAILSLCHLHGCNTQLAKAVLGHVEAMSQRVKDYPIDIENLSFSKKSDELTVSLYELGVTGLNMHYNRDSNVKPYRVDPGISPKEVEGLRAAWSDFFPIRDFHYCKIQRLGSRDGLRLLKPTHTALWNSQRSECNKDGEVVDNRIKTMSQIVRSYQTMKRNNSFFSDKLMKWFYRVGSQAPKIILDPKGSKKKMKKVPVPKKGKSKKGNSDRKFAGSKGSSSSSHAPNQNYHNENNYQRSRLDQEHTQSAAEDDWTNDWRRPQQLPSYNDWRGSDDMQSSNNWDTDDTQSNTGSQDRWDDHDNDWPRSK